jgi:competence protein ComEA
VTVVALIVAAVVALAGWWVLRSVPHPAPVQITSERSLPATASVPLSPSASPVVAPTGGALVSTVDAAADSAPLIVDVAGKVRRPGIVELPTGSRVVDALRAAGGARSGVDTTALNLARPLIDGEQIVVGLRVPAVDLAPSPGISGGVTSGAVASIDLNAASQEQLETLPGIGPVTATSILAWRTENGAFTSVDELLEVSGIGEVTLTGIEDYVHV